MTDNPMCPVLDDIDHLRIDLTAIHICSERSDFDPMRPVGEQLVDNDYRAAIRDEFSSVEDWEDWMTEPLLLEVKQFAAARASVEGMCMMLVRGGF